MTSITLTVTGAKARASVNGSLTSGMVGIPVTIEYDDMWKGLTKNLVCRCGKWGPEEGETRTVLNVGETATVAHEVMKAGMYLYLGIEGYSADGKLVIPTTWANCGKIHPGAHSDADPSASPKLSIWSQLQREIDYIKQHSVAESQIVSVVQGYLTKNPVEVTGMVTSVNGVAPDAEGNVEITIPGSTQTTAIATVDINTKKWFGKKIVVDGSSITSGGSGNTLPTWHSFLKDMFALDTVYNHSLSGSGWFIGGTTTTMNRVAEYEDDADAVILMGDYNGIYNYTRGQGTIDDEPSLEGMCYARLKYLAETLINKYPLCPIIWVIEPPRAAVGETDGLVPMVRDSDQAKYAAVIEEVAEYYGFTHCNLMKNTIFRPWIQANYDATTSDGTHPWNNIQRTMAQVIAETMKRTPLIYNESYVVTPDYSGDGDDSGSGDSGGGETPAVTLTSIKASANIGYSLFESDTLDAVKACIRVVATYSDLSEKAVTDYTVSGELVAGQQTFTITYGTASTTVTLTVTGGQRTVSIELLDQNVTEGYYLDGVGATVAISGYGYTDYIAVTGGTDLVFSGTGGVHGLSRGFVEYDEDKSIVQTVDTSYGTYTYTLAENTAYVRCNVKIGTANTLTYVPG